MAPASLWLIGGAKLPGAVARDCGATAARLRRDGAPDRGRGRRQRVSELVSMGDGKKFQMVRRTVLLSAVMREFSQPNLMAGRRLGKEFV